MSLVDCAPVPYGWPGCQSDETFMGYAVALANRAHREGDQAYGCVIIDDRGCVISTGRGSERPDDCTCHSEVVAIRAAQRAVGGTLGGCTLYSTFEPCMYCCGAICHSKVSRVVWGCERDEFPRYYRRRRFSAYVLLGDTSNPPLLTAGILREKCQTTTALNHRSLV